MSNRLSFRAEWYQEESGLAKKFILNYYPNDSCVEIFDLQTNKLFLRRSRLMGVDESKFYVGSKVNIFGRQLLLFSCADDTTRKALSTSHQRTFALIKSQGIQLFGEILKYLKRQKLSLNNCVLVELNGEHCDRLSGPDIGSISPGGAIALELSGTNAVTKLEEIIGSRDQLNVENNSINDLIFGCKNFESITENIEYFFGGRKEFDSPKPIVSFKSTTLAIIKPHALSKYVGDILADITDNDFVLCALKTFNLNRAQCEEFYEVYKNVVPEFPQMVIELSSGPFLVIEIGCRSPNLNVHEKFRNYCGPTDPAIAKKVNPNSLRGKYGENKVQNAVHCTDLEEDSFMEVEYFFKILTQ